MWKYHDLKAKELKKLYDKVSKQTQNKLQELFDTFNFTWDTLYDIADTKTKSRINEYIEQWKEDDLLEGYFSTLANNIYNKKRVKNSEILELVIYSAYMWEQNKLKKQEQEIMLEETRYYYKQGYDEVHKIKKDIPPFSIMDGAMFFILLQQALYNGYTYEQNIQATMQYNVQQIYKQTVYNIQQKKAVEINSDEFQRIFDLQNNQRLCINGDKISGFIDNAMIGINNLAKIEGMRQATGEDVIKVKFIAVTDKNSTEMCQSMNNMIFYVNKDNEFKRYWGETKGALAMMKVKVKGLVMGVNLPPISHYIHHCRSTITYQV